MSESTTASIPVEESSESQLGDLEQVLVRVLRVAYPHPFPDDPYLRTAQAILEAAASDRHAAGTLRLGLATLADAGFTEAADDAALARLRELEGTGWFRFVRAKAVTTLYDDREVWELLGYEGPSFELGGYLHRGFDDLDWLPDPRIERYDGDVAYTELGSLPYPVRGREEAER